jgi:protein SCO1
MTSLRIRSVLVFGATCVLTIIAQSTGSQAIQPENTGVVRTQLSFGAPSVTLTDDRSRAVRLDELLAERRPVIVQFIFTSCSTICGVLASTLAAAQADLAAVRQDYQAISITIDPEYDTPERLHEFAENFPPDLHWRLLTGRRSDIAQVLTAFDARFANDAKANHRAYTYLRATPDEPWVRIEGLISSKQLVSEYKNIVERAENTH